MWKRYTKDSVIKDDAQCLVLTGNSREYYEHFAIFRKWSSPHFPDRFVIQGLRESESTEDVLYYCELPAHLCIDGMSADEHPDLIDIAKNAVIS